MLNLNLIPNLTKNEVKLRHIFSFVKKISYLVLSITILISASFLTAKTILKKNYDYTKNESNSLSQASQEYSKKVVEMNAKFASILKIQEEFMPWSFFLSYIGDITPDEITLTGLNMSSSEKAIKISGKAATRDALLKFKDNINTSKYFKNMSFPPKLLLERENISFDITAELLTNDIIAGANSYGSK